MYLLQVLADDLMGMLDSAGLMHEGLFTAGSQVTISGPVTDQNRELWKYLETGLLYRSHDRRYEKPYVLVKNVSLFRDIGEPVFWTDESQIDLDMCYKVKLTLKQGEASHTDPVWTSHQRRVVDRLLNASLSTRLYV